MLSSVPKHLLFDIIGAHALMCPMRAGHLSCVRMVAARRTSASLISGPNTIEDLDSALDNITGHNSHVNNMRVKYGVWLVGRHIMTNVWLIQYGIKDRVGGEMCFGTGSGAPRGTTRRTSVLLISCAKGHHARQSCILPFCQCCSARRIRVVSTRVSISTQLFPRLHRT